MTRPLETWTECEACAGTGRILSEFRYSGEAYGGLNESRCDECNGGGGELVEAMCLCCDGPLDEHGWCCACQEYVGLTETVGDPLLRVRAAA